MVKWKIFLYKMVWLINQNFIYNLRKIDCSIKKCDAKYKIYMEYLTGEKPYHDNTEEIQPKPPGEKSYNQHTKRVEVP